MIVETMNGFVCVSLSRDSVLGGKTSKDTPDVVTVASDRRLLEPMLKKKIPMDWVLLLTEALLFS